MQERAMSMTLELRSRQSKDIRSKGRVIHLVYMTIGGDIRWITKQKA